MMARHQSCPDIIMCLSVSCVTNSKKLFHRMFLIAVCQVLCTQFAVVL